MPERIDGFAHVLPKSFFDSFSEKYGSAELDALSAAERFWDMSIRLELMETYDIDRQVITLARPPIWRYVDSDDALSMVELANDGIRELADEHNEFLPVATLPFGGPEYVRELERCLDELDMAGVQLFSNVSGEPIDRAYEGVFEVVADRDVPIWLHPQLYKWHEWDEDFMLHKMLGWPFDTSLALARLVYSGVMNRHPNLSVIAHHMAAMIPHFQSRIELFHKMLTEHRDVYPYSVPETSETGSLIKTFQRFVGDTCRGGDVGVLEDGLEFFGGDGLVFATDYPFGPEEGEGFIRAEVTGIEAMDVIDAQRADIFGGNLRSLL